MPEDRNVIKPPSETLETGWDLSNNPFPNSLVLPGGVVVDVNVFLFLLGLVGQRLHFLFDSSAFWQLSQHLQPPTRVLLHRRPKNVAINFVHCKRRRQRIVYIYSIQYINNTLPPALAVHEIYRDIFGPPMAFAASFTFSQYFQELVHNFQPWTLLLSGLATLQNRPAVYIPFEQKFLKHNLFFQTLRQVSRSKRCKPMKLLVTTFNNLITYYDCNLTHIKWTLTQTPTLTVTIPINNLLHGYNYNLIGLQRSDGMGRYTNTFLCQCLNNSRFPNQCNSFHWFLG